MAMESPAEASTTGWAQAPGLLRFRGPDAVKFLQGQLSNDMTALAADRFMLAGLHNPQGRVLALLQLAGLEADQVVALLPAELAEPTMATLRRYVLRARLTISNESNAAALAALAAQMPAAARALEPAARAHAIAAGLPHGRSGRAAGWRGPAAGVQSAAPALRAPGLIHASRVLAGSLATA